MQEYINSINTLGAKEPLKPNTRQNNIPQKKEIQQDKFEKQENKKQDKNKIIKTGIALTSLVLAGIAFLKRKQISNFISNLFKKKTLTPEEYIKTSTSKKVEIKPEAVNNADIKQVKFEPVKTKPAKKEPTEIKPETIAQKRKRLSLERAKEPTKINKPLNEFPTPKFSSNPTIEQRDEYVSELLKYINSTPDTKLQLKGLKEIEKYGINRDDICHIGTLTSDNDESIIREALKIYQKHGTNDDAFVIIGPIRRSEIDIKEEETFIEVLKTIQKLAHLENETPKDREIILGPVRRLLDNENENIRKMAQETLKKIDK